MVLSESLTGGLISNTSGIGNESYGSLDPDGVVKKIKNIKIIRYVFILSLYRFLSFI